MSKSGQVQRIFKILKILSEGGVICMKEEKVRDLLVLIESDVQPRSIQTDMQLVKEYLGDNLSYHNHCYKLVKKDILDDFFKDNAKEIRKFFHAIALIDPKVFGENFKKYAPLLEEIKVQQKAVYLFLENPFEDLKHLSLKEDIEGYIQERVYIDIDYKIDKLFKFKRVQAYKIIYQNGNWYLAVLTTEDYEVNGGFKLLRLNYIENIKPCRFEPYHFHEDLQVKGFLDNNFQSLFTSYDRKFFKVMVEVNASVARHFEVKKFLKSQREVGKKDGKLLVEFSINDDMEILPLVQMWLPKIRIIEPKYLHEKVLKNIRQYTSF